MVLKMPQWTRAAGVTQLLREKNEMVSHTSESAPFRPSGHGHSSFAKQVE